MRPVVIFLVTFFAVHGRHYLVTSLDPTLANSVTSPEEADEDRLQLAKAGSLLGQPAGDDESQEEGDDEEQDLDTEYDDGCPPGEYWHIRGQQCVTRRCPVGMKRNWKNGECYTPLPQRHHHPSDNVNYDLLRRPTYRHGGMFGGFHPIRGGITGDYGKGIRRKLSERGYRGRG